MRSVAPDKPGSAVSQNSSLLVRVNPTSLRRVATALHTIHTEKASRRHGIDIHRFRWATGYPFDCQKSESSGRQSSSTLPISVNRLP